eukprot:COSAG02_NODE_5340_length_4420_cov_55.186103_2_plen_183_part_00
MHPPKDDTRPVCILKYDTRLPPRPCMYPYSDATKCKIRGDASDTTSNLASLSSGQLRTGLPNPAYGSGVDSKVLGNPYATSSRSISCLLDCPAPRGSAGFVKCFPLGNSFPVPPPSLLSSVFETDHLNSRNFKCPDWHMTLGCVFPCLQLNSRFLAFHFLPNRALAVALACQAKMRDLVTSN